MRSAVILTILLIIFTLASILPASAQKRSVPTSAQRRERGYVSIGGGAQVATTTLTDRFVYTVNTEEATTEARYPSKADLLVDVGAGMRFWRNVGAAIYLSRSNGGGIAHTDSLIPHPFFDDQDRQVAGDAPDMSRTVTAAHAQLYYARARGRWRLRAGAGPSYFHLKREVVTGVTVSEEYPFDSATFSAATTRRASRSTPGFNVGADITRMFSRRYGATALVRFARGKIAFNVERGHRVSIDAGGAQAGAGIRIAF